MYRPMHPGRVVKEILVEGADLSITDAAAHLGVNRTTVSRLLNGRISISADMAIRLVKLLPNTDMALWMNLQRDYDIAQAQKRFKQIRVTPLNKAKRKAA